MERHAQYDKKGDIACHYDCRETFKKLRESRDLMGELRGKKMNGRQKMDYKKNWEKMKTCPGCKRMLFSNIVDSLKIEPDGRKMCPRCGEYVNFVTVRVREIYCGESLVEVEVKKNDTTPEIKDALLKTDKIKYKLV